MVFSHEGRKASHTFHRIMMKSAAKLSHPQAQAAIDYDFSLAQLLEACGLPDRFADYMARADVKVQ